MKLKLNEVAKIVSGKLIAQDKAERRRIIGVSTDSRTISSGELFVALKGRRFDGHNFVHQAALKGAVAAIVSQNVERPENFPIILVADTLRALGDLAADWRRRFNPVIVGITGSNGKTTVKEMIGSILSLSHPILKTEGNMNNLIGLPLTLFRLTEKERYVVLELGTSRFGEIRRLSEIASPQIGVITNIGPSHLEFFRDLEGVTREKGDLLQFVRIAVLNADNPFTTKLKKRARGRVLTFGFSDEADVRAERIDLEGRRMRFDISIGGHRLGEVKLSALGRHNVLNALASVCTAWALEIEPKEIIEGLLRFTPIHMRSELIELEKVTILNDAYNSNPKSLEAAIKVLEEVGNGRRKVAVLGDMLELGEWEDKLHRKAGEIVSRADLDLVITVGERSKAIATMTRAANKTTIQFQSTEEATDRICDLIKPGDVILLKASRAMRFERLVEVIKESICSTTSSIRS